MDLEIDIKEEPIWPEGTADSPAVSDPLLPAPDELAEVKVEPQHVFAVPYGEGAGVSSVKEENSIEDVKEETQDDDDALNPLEGTIQDVERAAQLPGGTAHFCVRCSKTFSQKSTLNRHLKIHRGEKPYRCEICKCRFSLKDTLRNHLLIHSKTKPFQCWFVELVLEGRGILGSICIRTFRVVPIPVLFVGRRLERLRTGLYMIMYTFVVSLCLVHFVNILVRGQQTLGDMRICTPELTLRVHCAEEVLKNHLTSDATRTHTLKIGHSHA